MGLWSDAPVDDALSDLAAAGATDVALVVAWGQADVHASTLAANDGTASDDAVRAAIRAATARSLRVMIFPIVALDETGPGAWRGTLDPDDVDAWWKAYERFILHYAAIAADEGAAALSVGSELGSTEAWRDRWFHLISKVEKVFGGELGYSANWDHYDGPSFWSRLDWIGVTGYFELTQDRDASAAALAAAWEGPRDALLSYAADAGKPLVLTEVGYPSVDGGAVTPWDYTRAGDVDLDEQRRAFAAFAAAWDGRDLHGVYVWEWSGTDDRGYTPRGKPAACVLEQWWSSGDPDPDPDPED